MIEVDYDNSVERIDLIDDFHSHHHPRFVVRACAQPRPSPRQFTLIGFHPVTAARLVALGFYACIDHVPIEGEC